MIHSIVRPWKQLGFKLAYACVTRQNVPVQPVVVIAQLIASTSLAASSIEDPQLADRCTQPECPLPSGSGFPFYSTSTIVHHRLTRASDRNWFVGVNCPR